MPPRPGPILRVALRAPRALYGRRLGWLLGRRFLLLEHVVRTSGKRHETMLEVIDYDQSSREAAVLSGWGRDSDWFQNVEAAGHAKITIGRETMAVDAFILDDQDAATVIGDYERRNRLIGPIIRRVLSHLAGFQYDASDDSRLALVRQLPVVRFTPSSGAEGP
jgi:deazaflavin-dependent oxidoreductase (nitroreductase family)